MFLNKDNMPKKNNDMKMGICSHSTETGKIIFTVKSPAPGTNSSTQRFINIYIAINKQWKYQQELLKYEWERWEEAGGKGEGV